MSSILLTGGTGFIGSHVAHRLRKINKKVILLQRKHADTWRIKDICKNMTTVTYDSFDDLEDIFKSYEIKHIIHTATKYVKHHSSTLEMKEIIESNITFPSILLQLANTYHTISFINTGTFFEYQQSTNPVNEYSPQLSYNFYASTKLAFENIVQYYSSNKYIKAITLKLFSPYGEKDNLKIIPLLIKSFIHSSPLDLTQGEQRLSFTYVEDIVDAYVAALNFLISDKYKKYEVFNIGSNKAYSLIDIMKELEVISAHKNNTIRLGINEYTENEIMSMICNNEKAKKILNWIPKTSISQGLNKTYNYYLKNNL